MQGKLTKIERLSTERVFAYYMSRIDTGRPAFVASTVSQAVSQGYSTGLNLITGLAAGPFALVGGTLSFLDATYLRVSGAIAWASFVLIGTAILARQVQTSRYFKRNRARLRQFDS